MPAPKHPLRIIRDATPCASAAEFAQLLGVPAAAVTAAERGKSAPTARLAALVHEATGADPAALLAGRALTLQGRRYTAESFAAWQHSPAQKSERARREAQQRAHADGWRAHFRGTDPATPAQIAAAEDTLVPWQTCEFASAPAPAWRKMPEPLQRLTGWSPALPFSSRTRLTLAVQSAPAWDPDAPPLAQVIQDLARRLATRPSRRKQPARHGARIDLRRSLRRSVRHGLDLVELARSQRKTRKTRIVMLCDVSGSMDAFNPFLLQLMFGLQQALKSSRTVVFSTQVSEITQSLRRRSIDETLREMSDKVRHWSGGTDIGAALGALTRGVLREGSSRSTVLIVISDGYDNGQPARIVQELAMAKRHIRSLVWINPMYGASTFTVRAAGMRAALPYVDHFLPAFNGRALHELVKGLARLAGPT